MRRRYSITYLLGQSIKGLLRNGVMSLASIAVLMSCLVVMGSFALLVYNINFNVQSVGLLNDIVVYVEKGRDDLEVTEIGNKIKAVDGVSSVVFVSKAQTLEEERVKYAEYTSVFDRIDETNNPFQDSFTVKYDDNSKVSTIEYVIENIDGVDQVNCRADLAENIENLKSGVIFIFSWFLVLLFLVSIFVIINTIKIAVFTRRQEISIMRYVGATNWFVVFPFVVEGILIGLLSSGIAYFAEAYLYKYVHELVVSDYQMIAIAPFEGLWHFVAIGFVLVGVIAGTIGSVISTRKYLKA